MPSRLQVTVSVDTDDIRDVLAYYSEGADAVQNPKTLQTLRLYNDRTIPLARREAYWAALRASLQYCIHEVEHGRAGDLRSHLERADREGGG